MRRLGLTLLILAGCTGNEGPCTTGACDCVDESDCGFVCNDVPCVGTCESLSTCDGACGDACTLSCQSTSDCDFACGDDCDVDCRSVSDCDVGCGLGCSVYCESLSDCRVEMVSGRVECVSVSNCDARCALPDGTTEPAEDCGDGVYVCAPTTCP